MISHRLVQPQQPPELQGVPKPSHGEDQLQARAVVIAWAFTEASWISEFEAMVAKLSVRFCRWSRQSPIEHFWMR